jgi:hypothetical protein
MGYICPACGEGLPEAEECPCMAAGDDDLEDPLDCRPRKRWICRLAAPGLDLLIPRDLQALVSVVVRVSVADPPDADVAATCLFGWSRQGWRSRRVAHTYR